MSFFLSFFLLLDLKKKKKSVIALVTLWHVNSVECIQAFGKV